MKKSLLALAMAAAFPALTYAQTNITLNGSLDLSLEWLDSDATGAGSDLRVTNGIWAGSRLSIAGTEDLGGGLKGIFNIEHRLAPDTGTVTTPATFWFGQAWVGLDGGFGAIRLGRQYTPMFRALVAGDLTGYSWYNSADAIAGFTTRFNNDVTYQSPNLGGFTLHAAYAAGESQVAPIDNDLGDAFGIGGIGTFGGFNLGAAYHNISAGDLPGVDDTTEWGVGAGGRFGNFGIGLVWAQVEVNNIKRKAYYLNGSVGVGPGTIYLTFKQDDQGTDLDNTGLGLTYSHGLSKRTFLYGSLGYNKIEQPVGDDLKPTRIALGVRHFF
jgi:predicted porin